MSNKGWKRREFLWGVSQSALTLAVLGRTSQQVIASTKKPTSVLVLGAGLSGLYTALLLEAKGISVTVLEARDRVGGRVHTLDDLPGKPEAGGMSFGKKYQRFLSLTKRLKLSLEEAQPFEKELLLNVRGEFLTAENWAQSTANNLAKNERNIIPPRLLRNYLQKNNPLENATDWTNPKHADLDISFEKYLRSKGASDEAIRLMGQTYITNGLDTTSALWSLGHVRKIQDYTGKPMHITGGNSRLAEKMAAALKSPVKTNKVVASIKSSKTGVEVNCKDDSKFKADYVVATLPFSVLREVEIAPALQEKQAEAVQELSYTAVTKIYLKVRQPFWEKDGYPPMTWTDSPLERIIPIRDNAGKVTNLICWVNGKNAQMLDTMSTKELSQFFNFEIKKIRPAMVNNVDIVKLVSWGKDPYAKGAYSYFAPGQIRRFRDVMAQPWGRIHFAGEHTAIASPGMESALESGERVAKEIFTAIG